MRTRFYLQKVRSPYECHNFSLVMKYFFTIFLILIGFTGMIMPDVFASENQLPYNMHSSAFGILEYDDVSGGPCMFIIPDYSVKSVSSDDTYLLSWNGFQHNYLAVIGNHEDASYQYLQIGLPSGSGHPSYLLDLKNQDRVMHGGLYMDYENLAVLAQTATSSLQLPEYDHHRFFKNNTKDVTFSRNALGPDDYSFDAILFKSDDSPWRDGESCVMHVEWPFVITEQGSAVTEEPLVTIGKLTDVTEIFPPLKQSKFGMIPESIRCKTDLQSITKQSDDDNNRVACVSSDTKSKLIERGWATQFRQNDPDCFTRWEVTLESDVDKDMLENMLLNEIAQFGDEYDLLNRDIVIDRFGVDKVIIGVQGCWGWAESGEPDLMAAIDNLEEVRDIN